MVHIVNNSLKYLLDCPYSNQVSDITGNYMCKNEGSKCNLMGAKIWPICEKSKYFAFTTTLYISMQVK